MSFLRDREGRLSHHKRSGWFSPWQAAWINLRAMFLYGADFFLLRPGLVVLGLGLALTLALTPGQLSVGTITFNLYWMLLGMTLVLIGLTSFLMGTVAQVLFDYTGKAKRRWLGLFPYTRTVLASAGLLVAGIALVIPLLVEYIDHHYRLPDTSSTPDHMAITGLACILSAFVLFGFTLLLHGSVLATQRRPWSAR